MKIAAQILNNRGIPLSRESIRKATEHYTKIYNSSVYKLYKLCYISTPSELRESELNNLIFRDNEEVFSKYFTSGIDGNVDLSYRRFEFALAVAKDLDMETRELLSILKDIMECKEAFDIFDSIVSKVKFPKATGVAISKSKILVTSRVENSHAKYLDNLLSVNALALDDDCKVEIAYSAPVLIEAVKKRLNDFTERTSESLFFEGADADVDNKYIDLILSGQVVGDTDFGRKLYKEIIDYNTKFYLDEDVSSESCLPFNETIFVDAYSEMLKYYNNLREEGILTSDNILYVNNIGIVYTKQGYAYSRCDEKAKDYVIGTCCVDSITGNELPKINCLRGYTGEFVSKDTVERFDYKALGLPIPLEMENGKIKEYYPLCNVFEYSDDNESLEPLLGSKCDLVFTELTAEEEHDLRAKIKNIIGLNEFSGKYTYTELSSLMYYVNALLSIELGSDKDFPCIFSKSLKEQCDEYGLIYSGDDGLAVLVERNLKNPDLLKDAEKIFKSIEV